MITQQETFWLVFALVIIAAASGILIWILLEAIGITKHALRALEAGKKVEKNSRILWAIPDVNTLLSGTLGTVLGISEKAGQLADALPEVHGENNK